MWQARLWCSIAPEVYRLKLGCVGYIAPITTSVRPSCTSLLSLTRVASVFFINLSGIRVFGEFELLFFSIKVAALTYWSHDDGIHYRPRR